MSGRIRSTKVIVDVSANSLPRIDTSSTFILETDASGFAIGAELKQVQNGVEQSLAYASKTLTKTERRYCVTRRELYAAVEFIRHFKQHS